MISFSASWSIPLLPAAAPVRFPESIFVFSNCLRNRFNKSRMTKVKETWMLLACEFSIFFCLLVLNLPKLHIFRITSMMKTYSCFIFVCESIMILLSLSADIWFIWNCFSVNTRFGSSFRK